MVSLNDQLGIHAWSIVSLPSTMLWPCEICEELEQLDVISLATWIIVDLIHGDSRECLCDDHMRDLIVSTGRENFYVGQSYTSTVPCDEAVELWVGAMREESVLGG